jgi:hypothetical protein
MIKQLCGRDTQSGFHLRQTPKGNGLDDALNVRHVLITIYVGRVGQQKQKRWRPFSDQQDYAPGVSIPPYPPRGIAGELLLEYASDISMAARRADSGRATGEH